MSAPLTHDKRNIRAFALAFVKWIFVGLSLNHFACYLVVQTTFSKSALSIPFSQIYYNIPFNVNKLDSTNNANTALKSFIRGNLSRGRFCLQMGPSIIPPGMAPNKFLIRNSTAKKVHYFILFYFVQAKWFSSFSYTFERSLEKRKRGKRKKEKQKKNEQGKLS